MLEVPFLAKQYLFCDMKYLFYRVPFLASIFQCQKYLFCATKYIFPVIPFLFIEYLFWEVYSSVRSTFSVLLSLPFYFFWEVYFCDRSTFSVLRSAFSVLQKRTVSVIRSTYFGNEVPFLRSVFHGQKYLFCATKYLFCVTKYPFWKQNTFSDKFISVLSVPFLRYEVPFLSY